jgi:hypothetical protein
MIQRLIEVNPETSVQLAADLGPSALITTFVVQNYSTNGWTVWLFEATDEITWAEKPFAAHEIVPGTAPVFQIASQIVTDQVTVWDLRKYWLIGDEGKDGEQYVCLTAYPLAGV